MQSEESKTDQAKPSIASSYRDAKQVFAYVLAYKQKLIIGIIAILLSTALQLVFPLMVGYLVDGTLFNRYGIGGDSPEWFQNLNTVGYILVSIVVLILIFAYIGFVYISEVGERGLSDLRVAAYQNLILLPMTFHARTRTGEISSRLLNDLAQIQELWIHDLRQFVRYFALAIGGSVMMFVIAPWLALTILAVAPIVIGISLWIGRYIRDLSSKSQDQLAKSAVVLEETLHGVEVVKAFHNEQHEIDRYRSRIDEFLPPAISGARSRGFFFCAILLISLVTAVFMMWYGSKGIEKSWISPGGFTSFMFCLAFASSSGGVLAELYGKLQRVIGANTRILEILGETPENLGESELFVERVRGEVEFRDVTFRYPSRREVKVLKEISLHAKQGERIALVGPSGAGKSTVIGLLLRFFDPESGEILIDGRPATQFALGALRAQMALVPQEVMLFGGSIRDNIAYGKPKATAAEIEAAAEKANAHQFIENLPKGYDTQIGDRGAQLSGGQRQRIALARAIIKDPAILILDEATSSLDSESEQLIQEALDKLLEERTSFVIAHRLSTVRKADKILVIRDGQIVESGTHDELIASRGFYSLLCEQQLS
ncbi:MAG: ABC-type multidrug transport system fused ATPase/permease subunit [Pseudoalteromonas tetraodonis]|jgi:ABC-type multidrug transport system fused ATPase/permease subunit